MLHHTKGTECILACVLVGPSLLPKHKLDDKVELYKNIPVDLYTPSSNLKNFQLQKDKNSKLPQHDHEILKVA